MELLLRKILVNVFLSRGTRAPALLFLTAVLNFFYHDQEKVSVPPTVQVIDNLLLKVLDIADELNSFLEHKFLYRLGEAVTTQLHADSAR